MPSADLSSLIYEAGDTYGPKIALADRRQALTYGELADRVAGAGAAIRARCQRGDRVLVIARNSTNAVVASLAAMAAGTVAVPLSPDMPDARLREISRDCQPALALCDGAASSTWHEELEVDVRSLDEVAGRDGDRPARHAREAAAADDLAVIFYTSGSTRTPRGVMCRHAQVRFCVGAINEVIQNTPEDVIGCTVVLSFDYGFYQPLLGIGSGATVILADTRSLMNGIREMAATDRITALPLVPSGVAALLRSSILETRALRSLRYVTSTGDTLSPSHIRRLAEQRPGTSVIPMYGLTECKRVSIMPPGRLDGHESSVGLPLPGTTVRVMDGGREVGAGEVGELYVRGANVTDGYWNDTEATRERFSFDAASGTRELRTGDLIRRDENGFLYFVSRADTVIKTCGERVGVGEVEAVLSGCDGVYEAAVFGLPDRAIGEEIVAWVSCDSRKVDVAKLREHCATYLVPAARPREFILTRDTLPRNVNGKFDRSALRNEVLMRREPTK
jgi:long-chain acyl-CoA synthetase